MSRRTPEETQAWLVATVERHGAAQIVAWGVSGCRKHVPGVTTGIAANNLLPFARGWLTARQRAGDAPPGLEPAGVRVSDDGLTATATVQAIGVDPPSLEEIRERFSLAEDAWVAPDKVKVRSWTTPMRNGEDIAQVVNWHVTCEFERSFVGIDPGLADRPAIPRLQMAAPRDVWCLATIPDIHFGYRWSEDFTYLDPMADRMAVDAALQLCARAQPEAIHLTGDNVDAAGLSDFDTAPELRQTLAFALREYRWTIEQLREACPHAEIIFTPGNHPDRLRRQMVRHIPELAGVMRDPVAWLLWDERNSFGCRLQNLGVVYGGPYPERVRIWDGVAQLQHGEATKASAQDIRTDALIVSYGHTHREDATRTLVDTARGPRYRVRVSPGTLGRVDGALPGPRHPDWQQGVGLAHYDRKSGRVSGVVYQIDRGAIINAPGGPITGRDRSVEIAEACGVPQFARRQAA